ncbi:RNA editing comple protein MP63 [Leishmania tarentolae]|uniref:RNA editing comple protein MP63 n=1 Tax=Leishmania tarentolae TaxID=5689 RepID=A0A640KXD6_LEITA|nr:RNA editing comple protein MP63 [Leishmania tarentolae]
MPMNRRIGVFAATAAACRCALRRLRHVSPSSMQALGAVASAKGTSHAALWGPVRNQSAIPDRRFHCSVCKKSFRLEMAAKLHLQQVHSGEGTVEAGAGPGQGEEQTLQTPVGVFRNAPPQAPTVVTQIVPHSNERAPRREKPAPKPLHQAEREVPSLVMEKMLSVWDDIGVKRMGNEFVHSSMVMRVFAARPSDSSEPVYEVMNPEGESPFEGGSSTADTASPITRKNENAKFYSIAVGDAFAMASDEALGPLRPARCPNPFLRKLAKDTAKISPRVESREQQTAPVTPFGQLPMFGQAASPATVPAHSASEEPSTTTNSVVSSPFAAGSNNSPFAGTMSFPLSGQGLFPFDSLQGPPEPAAAPPGIAEGSGASSEAPASPFASASGALPPSPFAAAPSPFTESSLATPSYAVGDAATMARSTEASDGGFFPSFSTSSATAPAEAVTTPTHVCIVCEKNFLTYDGLRMHSKAKHGKELPKELPKGRGSEKREVPDLPAFIPSPVDLTMTSPFGLSAQRSAWTEVELKPYAQSVSNITVVGRVLDTEFSSDGSLLFSLFVPNSDENDSEVIPVRCTSDALRTLGRKLGYGDLVFACGSLRILPFTDNKTQKKYSSAVVHVALPTGMISKLN